MEIIDISDSDNESLETIRITQNIKIEEELSDGDLKWTMDSSEEEYPFEYEPSECEDDSDDERDFDKLERAKEKEHEDTVEVNDWVSDSD